MRLLRAIVASLLALACCFRSRGGGGGAAARAGAMSAAAAASLMPRPPPAGRRRGGGAVRTRRAAGGSAADRQQGLARPVLPLRNAGRAPPGCAGRRRRRRPGRQHGGTQRTRHRRQPHHCRPARPPHRSLAASSWSLSWSPSRIRMSPWLNVLREYLSSGLIMALGISPHRHPMRISWHCRTRAITS